MSSVLRSLMIKIGVDLTDADKSLKQLSKNLTRAGKEITATGKSLTKGLTVPIVAAAAGLTTLAVKAGNAADELITFSNQTGVSTKTLQEWDYASRFIDVDTETMAKGLSKVVKAMGTATSSGSDFISITDDVSVSIRDSSGNLKDSEQVFYDTIDAIGKLGSETEKEIASQQLFGKSYQDMMPLIQAGSSALNKYAEEAKKLGLVLSDDDISAMGAFDDKMESLSAVAEVAGSKIGLAFIPIIEQLMPVIMNNIVPAIQKFTEWLSGLFEKFNALSPETQSFILFVIGLAVAIGPLLTIVGSLTTGIGGLVGSVGLAIKAFSAGGGLTGALGAFMGPAGWITLAIIAIAAAAYLIIKNWDAIKAWFVGLVDAIKTAWNNMMAYFAEKVQAIKDFFSSIGEAIFSVFTAITTKITTFIDNVKQTFELVKDTIVNIFSNIWNEIYEKFKNAWDKVKALFGVAGDIFSGIKEGIVNTFKTVVNGLIGGINKIIAVPFNAINGLLNKIRSITVFGIQPFINLWKANPLTVPAIPMLAGGGITNGPMHAIVGDNAGGREVISPLSDLKAMIAEVVNGNSGTFVFPIYIDGKHIKTVEFTSEELYRANKNRAIAQGVVAV